MRETPGPERAERPGTAVVTPSCSAEVCSDVKQSSFEEGAVIKKSPCNEFIPSVYVNVLSLNWDTR